LGPTYPPAQIRTQDSLYHSVVPERSIYVGTSGLKYVTTVGLQRWNTATQPDGVAWPANTVVSGAFFRARYANTENQTVDGDALGFEWYAWTPPISDAYWTNASPSATDPLYAGTQPLQNTAYRNTALTNVEQINLAGYTGIRSSISANVAPPTGINEAQYLSYEIQPLELPESLVVCWVSGAAPTATPTPSAAGSVTPMPTPTATLAPTNTATRPATATPSATPTATSVGQPSATPTRSAASSRSGLLASAVPTSPTCEAISARGQ